MTTWSKATLHLFGADLTQDEIDRSFGKAPRVFRHTNRDGRSQWLLESDHSPTTPLADHVADLADFVRALMNAFTDPDRRFEAELYCSFASENGQGEFAVAPTDMAILARAGVTLHVALYPEANIEDAKPVPDAILPARAHKPRSTWRETLCQRFDLVGFVSGIADEVTPHRFGIRCSCPLHHGADHSFSVDSRYNRWHCFGECGRGGDAVTLLASLYKITEDEALERVAAMVREREG